MSKRLLFFNTCSPITIARPSPNRVKCPNWWPAYACAIVSDPSGNKFPENIEVRARLGHYREKSDSKHNYMRSLKGLKSNLDEKTLKSGQVKLSDAIVEWRIMDPSRKGHGRMFLTGHTAVIHEKEVFDISFGIGNK